MRDFASSPRHQLRPVAGLFRVLQLSWPDRCWSDYSAKFKDGSPHCAFSIVQYLLSELVAAEFKDRMARKKPEGARPRYATIDGFDLDLVPRKIRG